MKTPRALVLALLLAASLLSAPPAVGAQSPAQKLAALADHGDLDALALELASLDLDSVPAAQRPSLAATLSAAAERAAPDQLSIALFCARRAAELQPTLVRYGALGRFATSAGDEAALADSLEGRLRLNPDDGRSLAELASLREITDPASALPLWRRALENGAGDAASAGVARCQRLVDEAEHGKPKEKPAPPPIAKPREPAAPPPLPAAAPKAPKDE